ncbi:HAD-IB family hydrolase [Actinoplanes sp. NBRC 103695]|uniref:HAD-IB family hydrolase n=1 Tax=Actinoplanes sp. NBRC 103695 TaxID=3032202 RepID=UPI0024A13EA4|nr:HAD-IB family hydrolase [Actinoplanes sp. NBRC 103695]GLY97540.1 haloacid dehalogenase [Actinoplanes sp. NBRC 103695]
MGTIDQAEGQEQDGHLLLTGATGFLGQATLERILASHPRLRVTLLVRGRTGTTAQERVDRLLRQPVFSRWRERVGAEVAAAEVAARVRVLDADLGNRDLTLPDDLTALVHGASTVSFDPPVDEAFRTNVQGVRDLYEAVLRSGGNPHVVHVSTAYVNGVHHGPVPEMSLRHDVDWQSELAAAEAARAFSEADSRRPATLRGLFDEAKKVHGKSGPRSTAVAAEARRQEWVEKQLVEHGRLRAKVAGWHDVYTFTKALGERVAETLLTGRRPLTVVRPAIVESALRHPYPGWIQGFKMAEPLILAYGRGQLTEFPGRPDGILDVIPVDMVVSAVLAAALRPPEPEKPHYLHVSSGDRNPLTFREMYEQLHRFFTDNPMTDGGYGHVTPPTWEFPGATRADRLLRTGEKILDLAQDALLRGPHSERTRRWQDDLTRTREDTDALRRLSDLYGDYVQNEAVYRTDKLLALHHSLTGDEAATGGFDPADIDWGHYLREVHFPAVTGSRRGPDKRRSRSRGPKEVNPTGDNRTVAIFDLEGTIVSSNLIETYLMAKLNELPRGEWAGEMADLLRRMPRYLSAERHDRGEFIRTFMRRWEGFAEADLRKIVADKVGDALLRRAHPQAIRRIRQHRKAGHRTVLITGTLDMLVEPIAPLFDETVTCRLHVRDGICTGFLDRPPLVGEARAAWLVQYAEAAQLDLASSYAYGDSYSDRPLLEAVGNPVAVNPDTRLYRHATRKRWAVADWTAHTMSAVDSMVETVW